MPWRVCGVSRNLIRIVYAPRAGRQEGHWIARLNRFRFKIAHVKGKDNTIADCLSRMYDEQDYEIQKQEGVVGTEGQVEHVEECGAIIESIPEAFTDMADWQAGDECQNIIKNFGTSQNNNYRLGKGLLLFRKEKGGKKILVPEKVRKMLMKYFHDSVVGGHMGITKTSPN
ncbi:hypothetical protein PR048_008174 [Dryococelus australis]|uniref:Polyprotein n=1 Tax=Dryococelus australis TaxID=614101 RepID=A0ABQ9HWN6_9NEOP|nr:hypothetical protein PR048_008174 [Dryococelus australis]